MLFMDVRENGCVALFSSRILLILFSWRFVVEE